jgi:EAL domain-containing protein (putative c-di-GMP-specific phosphodiesterase class I)
MIRNPLRSLITFRSAAIMLCIALSFCFNATANSEDIIVFPTGAQTLDLTDRLHPLATARTKLTLDVVGTDPTAKDQIELVASRPGTETTWYLVTLKNESKKARDTYLSLRESNVTSVFASGGLGKIKGLEGDTASFKLEPSATITLALESNSAPKLVVLQDKAQFGEINSGFSFLYAIAILAFLISALAASIFFNRRKLSYRSQNPINTLVADQNKVRHAKRKSVSDAMVGAEEAAVSPATAKVTELNDPRYGTDDGSSTMHNEDDPYGSIRTDLLMAFELGQFDVCFQPIYRLSDRKIEGLEAAIQWHHPIYGIVAWPYIVSVAAHEPMLEELDQFLMEVAIQHVGAWNRQNFTRQPLSLVINAGGLRADENSYCENLANQTLRNGLSRSAVTVQVQCASLGYYRDTVQQFTSKIKSQGFGFSGGNFGWGSADLLMLRTFAFDRLSLDASFFERGENEKHSSAFLKATVGYLRSLGNKIVATGIMDEMALRNANQLGCEHGQGYPHAYSLTTENLFDFLNANMSSRVDTISPSGLTVQKPFQYSSAGGFKLGQTLARPAANSTNVGAASDNSIFAATRQSRPQPNSTSALAFGQSAPPEKPVAARKKAKRKKVKRKTQKPEVKETFTNLVTFGKLERG